MGRPAPANQEDQRARIAGQTKVFKHAAGVVNRRRREYGGPVDLFEQTARRWSLTLTSAPPATGAASRLVGQYPALERRRLKYRSLVPSLALIFHLVDGGGARVGQDAWLRAEAWVEYLETLLCIVMQQEAAPCPRHFRSVMTWRITVGTTVATYELSFGLFRFT